MTKLLWIMLAGSLGTLARYAVGGWVQRLSGGGFPWGTLAVNLLGCFLFGLVWTLAERRALISGEFRIIALVGFMGAFTTFSTFAFESAQMIADAEWWRAGANVAAQNTLGIVGVFLGFALGRAI